jgi:hypothetical protein
VLLDQTEEPISFEGLWHQRQSARPRIRSGRPYRRREKNDGDCTKLVVVRELSGELPPIHHRHHQVEQNKEGFPARGTEILESISTMLRLVYRVPFIAQDEGERVTNVLVIFNDE